MACSAADYGVANFLGNYDAVVSLLTHLSLVERIKCGVSKRTTFIISADFNIITYRIV